MKPPWHTTSQTEKEKTHGRLRFLKRALSAWVLKKVTAIGGVHTALVENKCFVMTAKRIKELNPQITPRIIQVLCIFEGVKIQKTVLFAMAHTQSCERSFNG